MSFQQMFFVGRLANATGGTISYYQNWQIHTFTSSGIFAFTSYSGTPPVKFVVVNGGGTGVNGSDQTDNQDGVPGGAGSVGGLHRSSVGEYTAASFGTSNYTITVGGAGSGSSISGFTNPSTASGTAGAGGAGSAYNTQGGVGGAGGSGPDLSTNFPWLTRLAGGGGGGGGGSGEDFVGTDALGGAGGNLGGGAGGDGQQIGLNGTINTGGGGGGGGGANGISGGTNTGGAGGLGGSGIVIIAFQYIN
jgi:hypothetical protein